MKQVTAALVANGYPKRFVIDVGKPKRLAQQLSTTAPDAAKGFCILPYIKGTSEPIKWIGLLQQLVTWPIISKLLAAAKWISELQRACSK